MMKKSRFFYLAAAALILFFTLARAEGENDRKIPAGMELKQVGPNEMLVPVGMQVQKKGDLLVLESSEEYVARRLSGIEERLGKLATEQKALEEKVEKACARLNEIAIKGNVTADK